MNVIFTYMVRLDVVRRALAASVLLIGCVAVIVLALCTARVKRVATLPSMEVSIPDQGRGPDYRRRFTFDYRFEHDGKTIKGTVETIVTGQEAVGQTMNRSLRPLPLYVLDADPTNVTLQPPPVTFPAYFPRAVAVCFLALGLIGPYRILRRRTN